MRTYQLPGCKNTQVWEAYVYNTISFTTFDHNFSSISESKSENVTEDGSQALTVQVTAEQEAALHAFFQINGWNVTCVKQGKLINVKHLKFYLAWPVTFSLTWDLKEIHKLIHINTTTFIYSVFDLHPEIVRQRHCKL